MYFTPHCGSIEKIIKGVIALAYIIKRNENTYRLCVDVGENGKKKIKTKTIKITDPALLRTTRRLQNHLDLELKKYQLELMASPDIKNGDMLFQDYITLWQTRHVNRELEEKSRLQYGFHIDKRILPFFKGRKIGAISKQDVIEFIDYLHTPVAAIRGKALGASSILYIYRVLRSLFSYAQQWDIIPESPMIGIKKPKEPEKPSMQVYDEVGLIELFNAIALEPSKVRTAVMLAVTCGMRRGEIAGLEWRHIDFNKRTIDINQSIPMNKGGMPVIKSTKTGRKGARVIAMPMILVDQLLEYKQHWDQERWYAKTNWGFGDFLFCHESGQPHDPHWFTDMWIALRKKHGLKEIRFHDLRHTAATWMIKQNVHPKAIANRLGHVNIKTTMDVYGHVIESVDQAAASVFDDMPVGNMPRGALLPPSKMVEKR